MVEISVVFAVTIDAQLWVILCPPVFRVRFEVVPRTLAVTGLAEHYETGTGTVITVLIITVLVIFNLDLDLSIFILHWCKAEFFLRLPTGHIPLYWVQFSPVVIDTIDFVICCQCASNDAITCKNPLSISTGSQMSYHAIMNAFILFNVTHLKTKAGRGSTDTKSQKSYFGAGWQKRGAYTLIYFYKNVFYKKSRLKLARKLRTFFIWWG